MRNKHIAYWQTNWICTWMTALNQQVLPTFLSPTGQLPCRFLSWGFNGSTNHRWSVRFRFIPSFVSSAMLLSRTLETTVEITKKSCTQNSHEGSETNSNPSTVTKCCIEIFKEPVECSEYRWTGGISSDINVTMTTDKGRSAFKRLKLHQNCGGQLQYFLLVKSVNPQRDTSRKKHFQTGWFPRLREWLDHPECLAILSNSPLRLARYHCQKTSSQPCHLITHGKDWCPKNINILDRLRDRRWPARQSLWSTYGRY